MSDATFLSGGGQMGLRIRSHPWAATPLGAPETWPQSLRSALSICLHSSFPTAIYWGPELRLLYNDAWAPIPAERHPWALGRPAAEVWHDIWKVIGPQFERVLLTGEGFSTYDQMLPMIRGGQRCDTYWNYSFTAIRGEDGSVVGVFNQGNETTAEVIARRQAEAEIERLGRMFQQAPGAVAILRGGAHEFEFVNDAYARLVGEREFVGKTVVEALPEVNAQGFISLLDQVYESGEPVVGRAVPVFLHRRSGEKPEQLFVDFVYQPLVDGSGQCSGIFVQATDVTEAHRFAEARQLLLEEMSHRVKNLFAVTSGIVAMTARSSVSVSQMAEALHGRLEALAKAHEMVRLDLGTAREGSASSTLQALLEVTLKPYQESDRITFEGPNVPLGEQAVARLALPIHELTTNAVKYGALSSSSGRLAVAWALEDGLLKLRWIERLSNEMLVAPSSSGFGSKLTRTTIESQLGGSIDFAWQSDGLRVSVEIPVVKLAD